MKQITVAVCLDDEKGMMFGGRRQSRDRVLIADFVNAAEGRTIFIGEYSQLLFREYLGVAVCENPMEECSDGGVCFVEALPLVPHLQDIHTLILYHWNRLYPADRYFDVEPEKNGFSLVSVSEFEGSSHERITKEIYRK